MEGLAITWGGARKEKGGRGDYREDFGRGERGEKDLWKGKKEARREGVGAEYQEGFWKGKKDKKGRREAEGDGEMKQE